MDRKHKVGISRATWRIIVFAPMVIGLLLFEIFGSTFFICKESYLYSWIVFIGGLLIGIGFGLAYARAFLIEGIDT